ncbi:unnamed protein product [Thelazia callipaeda]|uniref:WAP domain-containing protein n=1 Tax=Thelazia callipaeda TaxID=103827 RepID=A0A0N5D8M0_THECL|nr:unnamed protein product [Thelazia callipaeda]
MQVKEPQACNQSCAYLRQIYGSKPGNCPNSTVSAPFNECSALCHMDGDCEETKKCCKIGCSRQCLKPRGKDVNLLPIPTGISVQERKRKRSVIVRWVMQQMSKSQMNSNANLYVVQWRWSLHKDGLPMSDWQTIVARNKMYAILKHLLAPGRYYTFRVASVNTYGSLGFSRSSQPFKLSKEPRAPGQPRDLSVISSEMDEKNLWKQRIKWTPPHSELPIKNYVLSWQRSSTKQAVAYEELLKRRQSNAEKPEKRSTLSDDDEEGENEDSFMEQDRMSLVVPAYHSYADINPLQPLSVYLIEVRSIYATVDSSDGELHGEKAIIYVRTKSISDVPSSTVKYNDRDTGTTDKTSAATAMIQYARNEQKSFYHELKSKELNNGKKDVKLASLDVRIPYYDDGNLKTVVSWFNSDLCLAGNTAYTVRWRLLTCRTKSSKRLTYYDLDPSGEDWAEMQVNECVAVLEDLDFICSYYVQLINGTKDKPVIARGFFETQSCSDTPSTSALTCEDQRSSDLLSCIVNSKNNSASCSWEAEKSENEPVGYRIVLSASTTNDNQIVIRPPQVTTVQFDKLEENRDYFVHIQTITSNGLGKTLISSFRINGRNYSENSSVESFPSSSLNRSILLVRKSNQPTRNTLLQSSSTKQSDGSLYNNERFPGAAVLELPLESATANIITLTPLLLMSVNAMTASLFANLL